MRGLTSPLWPVRFKPLPDELLSCWLVRLAHGHGLKAQTFCNLLFGNKLQVWNRDVDRLAPEWLLKELTHRTGTSPEMAFNTTLRVYEGLLYPKFRLTGTLQWILTLKIFHRKRHGYGLQFCPACLAEDDIPYFRKQWRIAFNTVCIKHATMLHDRCPNCGMAIAVHRLDMSSPDTLMTDSMCYCHSCQYDLRNANCEQPITYDHQASQLLLDATRMASCAAGSRWDIDRYAVMRQLCLLMTAPNKKLRLREFVLDQLSQADMELKRGYFSFEMRAIEERHHLMQLTAWILTDIEPRLTTAWREGCVRYNVLLKDFPDKPDWYDKIVKKFINWRKRFIKTE